MAERFEPATGHRQPPWLNVPLAVTFTAVATTSMVADGIVPALPVLQRELHASTDAMGWFYTAPMLAAVVCTPIVSRLASIVDKRRVLDGILLLLFAGMALSASARAAPMLVLGQLLSGVSLSLLPLSVGLISEYCDPVSARTANAIVAALGALTPCIGLMICGPIVDHLSFRWLFWGPAALLGTCLIVSLLSPRSPRENIREQSEPTRLAWCRVAVVRARLRVAGHFPLVRFDVEFGQPVAAAGVVVRQCRGLG